VRTGLAACAALAAGAIVLAGCGGSGTLSKSAYEKKLKADSQELRTAFGKIEGNPSSLAALAKQVDSAKATTKKVADDLDSAKPPKDAAADNDKIVAALRALDAPLGKLKEAAAKGSATLAAQAARAISNAPELKDATAAAQDLKRKGYDVGGLGS
jgi:hypothetical protein